MKSRTLGKSGIAVSEIGLGCWQLGGDFGPLEEDRARRILDAAAEEGITFWDTADVYGGGLSERRIGAYRKESGAAAVVATKVGRDGSLYPDGYTKEKVRAGIEGSARRLGVETLDLLQLHCVPPEVLKAGDMLAWMEEFQAAGLIRAFGASVETIEEAKAAMESPALTSLQIIFNVFRQNAIDELFPLAEANDVGIVVRLPLASGVRSGDARQEGKRTTATTTGTVKPSARAKPFRASRSRPRSSSSSACTLGCLRACQWRRWPCGGSSITRQSARSSPGRAGRNRCRRTQARAVSIPCRPRCTASSPTSTGTKSKGRSVCRSERRADRASSCPAMSAASRRRGGAATRRSASGSRGSRRLLPPNRNSRRIRSRWRTRASPDAAVRRRPPDGS